MARVGVIFTDSAVRVFQSEGTDQFDFSPGTRVQDVFVLTGPGRLFNCFGSVYGEREVTSDDAPYLFTPCTTISQCLLET